MARHEVTTKMTEGRGASVVRMIKDKVSPRLPQKASDRETVRPQLGTMVSSHLVLGAVATWCFVWAAPGAHGVPTSAGNAIQTEDDLVNSIHADCLKKDSVSCLKYQIYSLVDRTLGRQGDIALTEGVTIVKTGDGETEGAPRALNAGKSEFMYFIQEVSTCFTRKSEFKSKQTCLL